MKSTKLKIASNGLLISFFVIGLLVFTAPQANAGSRFYVSVNYGSPRSYNSYGQIHTRLNTRTHYDGFTRYRPARLSSGRCYDYRLSSSRYRRYYYNQGHYYGSNCAPTYYYRRGYCR